MSTGQLRYREMKNSKNDATDNKCNAQHVDMRKRSRIQSLIICPRNLNKSIMRYPRQHLYEKRLETCSKLHLSAVRIALISCEAHQSLSKFVLMGYKA